MGFARTGGNRATGIQRRSLPPLDATGSTTTDNRGDEAVYAGYYVGARRRTGWSGGRRRCPRGRHVFHAAGAAGDWSPGRTTTPIFEFFRLLPASATWEEAFEAAFGIAVDDFYEAFEEYRIALGAEYLPHLADDRDEPLLLFLGEIPTDTRTLLREQFETARELFRDRFASGPVDYTVYVAADQSRTVDYTVLEAV